MTSRGQGGPRTDPHTPGPASCLGRRWPASHSRRPQRPPGTTAPAFPPQTLPPSQGPATQTSPTAHRSDGQLVLVGGLRGAPGLSPPGRVLLLRFRAGRHRRVRVSLLWGRQSLGVFLVSLGSALQMPAASPPTPPSSCGNPQLSRRHQTSPGQQKCPQTTAPKALTPQIFQTTFRSAKKKKGNS